VRRDARSRAWKRRIPRSFPAAPAMHAHASTRPTAPPNEYSPSCHCHPYHVPDASNPAAMNRALKAQPQLSPATEGVKVRRPAVRVFKCRNMFFARSLGPAARNVLQFDLDKTCVKRLNRFKQRTSLPYAKTIMASREWRLKLWTPVSTTAMLNSGSAAPVHKTAVCKSRQTLSFDRVRLTHRCPARSAVATEQESCLAQLRSSCPRCCYSASVRQSTNWLLSLRGKDNVVAG